jgi:hypothetical protein
MPPLDELSLVQRILLAVSIVVFALLLLMAISRMINAPAEAQTQNSADLYEGIPLDIRLLHLDKDALNSAYNEQIQHLFFIWLKGSAASNLEITNGLKNARRAYNIAAVQIAKREHELLELERQQDQKLQEQQNQPAK